MKINDLEMKRPKDNSINPINVEKLIGKLLTDLKAETPIKDRAKKPCHGNYRCRTKSKTSK